MQVRTTIDPMSNQQLCRDLLMYGKVITDLAIKSWSEPYHRVRVIELDNIKYWLHQINGEIIHLVDLS